MAKGKDFKALTYLMLGDTRKEPGDTISAQEFKDAGQDDDQIAQLMETGAISDDLDAELHKAHLPPEEAQAPEGSDRHVIAGDSGGAEDAN